MNKQISKENWWKNRPKRNRKWKKHKNRRKFNSNKKNSLKYRKNFFKNNRKMIC